MTSSVRAGRSSALIALPSEEAATFLRISPAPTSAPGGAADGAPAAHCWSARHRVGHRPGRLVVPSCAASALTPQGPRRPHGSACRWSGRADRLAPELRRIRRTSAWHGLLSRTGSSSASRCPPERVSSTRWQMTRLNWWRRRAGACGSRSGRAGKGQVPQPLAGEPQPVAFGAGPEQGLGDGQTDQLGI